MLKHYNIKHIKFGPSSYRLRCKLLSLSECFNLKLLIVTSEISCKVACNFHDKYDNGLRVHSLKEKNIKLSSIFKAHYPDRNTIYEQYVVYILTRVHNMSPNYLNKTKNDINVFQVH